MVDTAVVVSCDAIIVITELEVSVVNLNDVTVIVGLNVVLTLVTVVVGLNAVNVVKLVAVTVGENIVVGEVKVKVVVVAVTVLRNHPRRRHPRNKRTYSCDQQAENNQYFDDRLGLQGCPAYMFALIHDITLIDIVSRSSLHSMHDKDKTEGKEAGDLSSSYLGLVRSIMNAASVGTTMMQVRTIAELATASSRNEPATSPSASNAKAAASSSNEPFATRLTLIFLLRMRALTPSNVKGVR